MEREELIELIAKEFLNFKSQGYLNVDQIVLGRNFLDIDLINKIFLYLGYDGEELVCKAHFYANYGQMYSILIPILTTGLYACLATGDSMWLNISVGISTGILTKNLIFSAAKKYWGSAKEIAKHNLLNDIASYLGIVGGTVTGALPDYDEICMSN